MLRRGALRLFRPSQMGAPAPAASAASAAGTAGSTTAPARSAGSAKTAATPTGGRSAAATVAKSFVTGAGAKSALQSAVSKAEEEQAAAEAAVASGRKVTMSSGGAATTPQGARSARDKPWWDNLTFTAAMVAVGLTSIVCVHFARRAFYSYRGNATERDVARRIGDQVRDRPHWAAALVYSTLAHAMSTQPSSDHSSSSVSGARPFGFPLMTMGPYADILEMEVAPFLLELHQGAGTAVSMSLPDLWAIATAEGVRSLGGPMVPLSCGRFPRAGVQAGTAPDAASSGAGGVTDPPILQRLVPTAAAAAAANAAAASLTSLFGTEVAPGISVLDAAAPTATDLKRALGSNGFTPDEMVALMGLRTLGAHGPEGARVLGDLAGVSEKIIERHGRHVALSAASESAPAMGSTSPGVLNNEYFVALMAGEWGRGGDASRAAGATWWNKLVGGKSGDASGRTISDGTALLVSPVVAGVRMAPVDALLISDSLLHGWVSKFASNELAFFGSLESAIARILDQGWRPEQLRQL